MFSQVDKYIRNKARPLDVAQYLLFIGEIDNKLTLSELIKYQNDDGGFGNGIEPDLQAKASTAVSTSVAFQNIIQAKIENADLISRAINYLEDTFDSEDSRWYRIVPEVNQSPHAPWWTYQAARMEQNWANPTVELTGYLIHYKQFLSRSFPLAKLIHLTQEELLNNPLNEVHDLLCYRRYFELNPNLLSSKAKQALFKSISDVVEIDSNKWDSYVPKPLDFITSPTSPFAVAFPDKLVQKNIDYLKSSIITDHWEPTWNWGAGSEGWEKAKNDWSGYLTVRNLQKLIRFGQIKN